MSGEAAGSWGPLPMEKAKGGVWLPARPAHLQASGVLAGLCTSSDLCAALEFGAPFPSTLPPHPGPLPPPGPLSCHSTRRDLCSRVPFLSKPPEVLTHLRA